LARIVPPIAPHPTTTILGSAIMPPKLGVRIHYNHTIEMPKAEHRVDVPPFRELGI
jgi:hypothetical protein